MFVLNIRVKTQKIEKVMRYKCLGSIITSGHSMVIRQKLEKINC